MRALVGFSRTETNAFIILLPLLFIIVFSQPLYNRFVRSTPQVADTVKLNRLLATWKEEPAVSLNRQPTDAAITMFSFNPNTASELQLKQLGFNQFQITSLMKYRAKGGKFTVRQDLSKLYGMDSIFYQRLFPFIELPTTKSATSERPTVTQRREWVADINTADTTQLKAVYGIGAKLAQRIIRYRDKLGGFVSMRQLQEVYGLDSAVVKEAKQKFKVEEGFVPKQFNVNTATAIELAKHPYFKKNISKAIETYRFQHGPFTSLDDLVKIQLVTPDDLARIKPYLTLNP